MSVAESRKPTPADLLTRPLEHLLAEVGARVVESSIADDGFFGAAHLSPAGISLHMPAGRSEVERDSIARALLGRVLQVPLPPLPAVLSVEEAAV
ncbi:hypothetical protein [Streptomyces sp.]|uniref:hypothetical protein n=1 Tax=Streptomyces sp. TaxID=1931 RepID=UPI002F94EE8A